MLNILNLCCGIFIIIFFIIIGFTIGINVGENDAKQKFERNAVKSGAAVWLYDKDTGEPVIRWVNTPLSKETIEGE